MVKTRNRRDTRRHFLLALGVSILIAAAIGVGARSGVIERLRMVDLDLMFQLRGPIPASGEVTMVLIDQFSIEQYGRWPWPRSLFARLTDRLNEMGARSIVFDLLFTDTGDSDDDARFVAATERSGRVVLPYVVRGEEDSRSSDGQPEDVRPPGFAVAEIESQGLARIQIAGEHVIVPFPALMEAAAGLGHANVAQDETGAAPYHHVAARVKDTPLPSLALAAARIGLGLPREALRFQAGERLLLGDREFALDAASRLPVNWRGPGAIIDAVSAATLLDGDVSGKQISGRTVVIGSTVPGAATRFPSPFEPLVPGVARQATIIDMLIAGDPLRRDETTGLMDQAMILAAGLAAALASSTFVPAIAAAGALAIAGVGFAAAVGLFMAFGTWTSPLAVAATPLLVYAALSIDGHIRRHREAMRLRGAFSSYLHPALVEVLIEHPEQVRFGGERRELTVLFSDIRGFTSIAERLTPEQLLSFINAYHSAMTETILEEGGYIDKYIGDGILAVFGAPLLVEDHALRACRCADAMIRRIEELKPRWDELDVPDLKIGVGINTGLVTVGNIGSEQRFDYTVLGDEVNICARLEELNKTLGTTVVVSCSTARAVGDAMLLSPLGWQRIRGREGGLQVFTLG